MRREAPVLIRKAVQWTQKVELLLYNRRHIRRS